MVYDLIVVGGGPAGCLAAEKVGKEGLSVLLAEKSALGGVCLNEGCIPTKTLLYSAKLYDSAVNSQKYGVTVEKAVLDHEAVLNRKNKVVRMLAAGVKAKLRDSNVTVVEGPSEILGKTAHVQDTLNNCTGLFDVRVGENSFKTRNILAATGSETVVPIITGINQGMANGTVLTNSGILALREVPEELVIIGGGVIGLEMASYFNSAGSKVTVIEMLDHVGGSTDSEIAGILMKHYIKKGIVFKLNSKVTEIRSGKAADERSENGSDGSEPKAEFTEIYDGAASGDRKAEVVFESGGYRFEARADKVLLSVGRRPSIDGLGLESIGVRTGRGCIITDRYGCTNVHGVYAAGDVNGISMLAHTACREAEVCINNMLGREDIMRYDAIPSVIYTNPEVASVGETEETAYRKGIDYEAAKLPMTYSGRYSAENEAGSGICKILLGKGSRKIIGVHMIGNYASEIIYGAAMMIERGMTADEVRKTVFPHPTVSEIIKEVLCRL